MWGDARRGGTSMMKLCGANDVWKFDVATSNWTQIVVDTSAACDGAVSSDVRRAAPSLLLAKLMAGLVAFWGSWLGLRL